MVSTLAVAVLNHLLGEAPWARSRLAAHARKAAVIQAGGLVLRLAVADDGYLAEDLGGQEPAVTITLPSAAPSALRAGVDALMRNARVEGEVEFADTLGFVLRHLRWDAEADLARVFGDIAAHRLHGLLRSAFTGTSRAVQAVEGNLREFASEGRTPFVPRQEVELRADALRLLRDGLARLEKRLDRL